LVICHAGCLAVLKEGAVCSGDTIIWNWIVASIDGIDVREFSGRCLENGEQSWFNNIRKQNVADLTDPIRQQDIASEDDVWVLRMSD